MTVCEGLRSVQLPIAKLVSVVSTCGRTGSIGSHLELLRPRGNVIVKRKLKESPRLCTKIQEVFVQQGKEASRINAVTERKQVLDTARSTLSSCATLLFKYQHQEYLEESGCPRDSKSRTSYWSPAHFNFRVMTSALSVGVHSLV